jgi:hypothetical protein
MRLKVAAMFASLANREWYTISRRLGEQGVKRTGGLLLLEAQLIMSGTPSAADSKGGTLDSPGDLPDCDRSHRLLLLDLDDYPTTT